MEKEKSDIDVADLFLYNTGYDSSPKQKDVGFSRCSQLIFTLLFISTFWLLTTGTTTAKLSKIQSPLKNGSLLELPLSLDYEILITTVNQDPENVRVDLNVEDIQAGLDPLLKKLTPIANFDLKFQRFDAMELGAKVHKNETGFILYEKYVPHVILPIEKKLQSFPTAKRRINLILYVPKCDVTPLYIANSFDKLIEDNSYLTPKWGGGIYFANQLTCGQKYFEPNMTAIIKTFTSQIKRLIKLRSDNETDLFEFKRETATNFVKMARRNLKSISQFRNIVKTHEIDCQIHSTKENCDQTNTLLKAANVEIEQALKAAKAAFNASQNALDDASILSLLYPSKH